MHYTQLQPTAALKPYVRYFGLLEDSNSCDQIKTFKIISDACPGLIFQENPDCFLDKNKRKLPQLFLHGLASSHSEKTTTGQYRNIGVYFQPGTLRSLFGIDASELTDRYEELSAIIPTNLSEQLLNERHAEQRIELLSGFLLQQLKRNGHKAHSKTALAIGKIRAQNNTANLSNIQSDFNISERALQRIFNAEVGISPKLFLRINRFQSALDYMRKRSSPVLTNVAYQYAYADQSHFIREFKEFAGVSPRQFILNANEQAVNFPEWKS